MILLTIRVYNLLNPSIFPSRFRPGGSEEPLDLRNTVLNSFLVYFNEYRFPRL